MISIIVNIYIHICTNIIILSSNNPKITFYTIIKIICALIDVHRNKQKSLKKNKNRLKADTFRRVKRNYKICMEYSSQMTHLSSDKT